jgi:hypothetical protein
MSKIIAVQTCGTSVVKYYENSSLILVKEQTRNWEIPQKSGRGRMRTMEKESGWSKT